MVSVRNNIQLRLYKITQIRLKLREMRLRGLRSCTSSDIEEKQMDIFQRKSVYEVLCPQEVS